MSERLQETIPPEGEDRPEGTARRVNQSLGSVRGLRQMGGLAKAEGFDAMQLVAISCRQVLVVLHERKRSGND